jgi:hypothetical protein
MKLEKIMWNQNIGLLLTLITTSFVGHANASDNKEDPDTLAAYLTDVTAGAVSAGNIVGLQESAITSVQTSQDLLLALKPLTSSSSKNGFGLAISPFRTTIAPMSGQSYANSNLMRFVGGMTLSYAENNATLASTSYRKSAFSVDSSYYLSKDEDPVIAGNYAFSHCHEKDVAMEKYLKAAENDDAKGMKDAQKLAEDAVKACVDTVLKRSAWNASRISVSFGAGSIKPDDNSVSKESLGRSMTVNGILRAGDQGAFYLSLRRTNHEVDLASLMTTAIAHRDSNLAAARYTYGSKDDNGDLKALVEVSNAKASVVTVSNNVYKYAIGIDKKIIKGLWFEFRIGRNHTFDGKAMQTTSLLNLNISPSAMSTLFGK